MKASMTQLLHKNATPSSDNNKGAIYPAGRRKTDDMQRIQSRNLKSIGLLAAGIAHEINTPLQFVSDNIYFLEKAFADISQVVETYECLFQEIKNGRISTAKCDQLAEASRYAEMDYLKEEIPLAISQTLEGLNRVSKIVMAMKEFSHPGLNEKVQIDINRAILSTLTVTKNEWKHHAVIKTELGERLPLVACFANEINQVILNIILNAIDAIKDVKNQKRKGTITINTRRAGAWVEIRIRDTGSGIPENIRTKIFDPFFTTKDVGRGTGQGLNIAYSVVVNKHGGTIRFQSIVGKGTTFIIRLPIEGGAA